MRILNVSCSYLPHSLGGTEVYLHWLNRELLARGHDVFVFHFDQFYKKNGPPFRFREYTFEDVRVFAIERNTSYLKLTDLYYDTQKNTILPFEDYLKIIQPDVVNFHHLTPIEITLISIVKNFKIPLILTCQTCSMFCGSGGLFSKYGGECDDIFDNRKCLRCNLLRNDFTFIFSNLFAKLPDMISDVLYRIFGKYIFLPKVSTFFCLPFLNKMRIQQLRKAINLFDFFIVFANWELEMLIKNGIAREKIFYTPHGLPEDCFLKLSKNHDGNGVLKIGYIGRLHEGKGLEILLKSFAKVTKKIDAILYVYGSQENEIFIRNLKRKYPSEKIKWMGRLALQEKPSVLNSFDMLVVPTLLRETGPLIILEAWACGVPVIASRIGGVKELIPRQGWGGVLFDPGNAKQLSQIFLDIFNQPSFLEKLRSNIPIVRSIKYSADETEGVLNLAYSIKKKKNYE